MNITMVDIPLGIRKKRHPLLSFPYIKDASWPDGSDNRFEQGMFYSSALPFSVTKEELLAAGPFPIWKDRT